MSEFRRGSAAIADVVGDPRPDGSQVDDIAVDLAPIEDDAAGGLPAQAFVEVEGLSPLDFMQEFVDQLGQAEGMSAIVSAGITPGVVEGVFFPGVERDTATLGLGYVLEHKQRHGALPAPAVLRYHLESLGFPGDGFGRPHFHPSEFLRQFKRQEAKRRARTALREMAKYINTDLERGLATFKALYDDLIQRTRAHEDGVVDELTYADLQHEPIEWLWEGYVATRTVTILSGEPGVNKSTMAFGIAAGLSTGKSGPPANSLILSTEDSHAGTIKIRLCAAGADLDHVRPLQKRRNGLIGHLQFPEDLPDLHKAIQKHDAKLVIIDPLMGHLSGAVDSWKEQSIRQIMSQLYHIADDTGCAILSINHLNKSTNSNALNRVGGSMGIAAASRSVLLMAKNPNDPNQRLLTSTKLNIGEQPLGLIYELRQVDVEDMGSSMRLERVGTTTMTSDDILGPKTRVTAAEQAEDMLHDMLSDGTAVNMETIKERAEREGLAWRVVQTARTNMGCIKTTRSDGVTMWQLDSE